MYVEWSRPLETLYHSLHLKLVHETQKVSFTGHDFSFAAQQRIIDVRMSQELCLSKNLDIVEAFLDFWHFSIKIARSNFSIHVNASLPSIHYVMITIGKKGLFWWDPKLFNLGIMAFVMSHMLNLQHSESDGQTNDEQRKKKAGGFYFRIRVCIRITYFDCILKKKVEFSFESRIT